ERGQAVEGVVDLDGVELLGVALEPPALGAAAGIQDAAPVGVVPPAAADPDGLHRAPRSPRASSTSFVGGRGLCSAAAGWYIGNRVRPSRSTTWPCTSAIAMPGAKRLRAWRPSGTS